MTDKTEIKNEMVVFLHGILRNKIDMHPLSKFFQSKGYDTQNILYPSREQTLEDLSDFVHEKIINWDRYSATKTLHFVTHSMGGLIARYYIERHKPENLGKVVMLGPPNTGSEFADFLSDTKFIAPAFRTIYGPASAQLRTDYEHIDKKINYPLGVIAGNVSINPLASFILEGDHDGIVPVSRTYIDGMADHIIVPATHTFMMFSAPIMEQALSFIINGKFDHDKR